MYKVKTMLLFYAETPIHPGAGSGTGAIDLPIQREAFSDLPIFQSSGIKGALREYFEAQAPGWPSRLPTGLQLASPIVDTFGPDTASASDHAGALAVGDAKVLVFPIRSLYGVFACLTCPLVLQRFRRDLDMVGASVTGWPSSIPSPVGETIRVISQSTEGTTPRVPKSLIIAPQQGTGGMKAVFNEFAFSASEDADTRAIAEFIRDHCLPDAPEYVTWKQDFLGRFAIVPDDVFRDFTRLATEIVSRNRIDDEKGTVEEGALWTEEHLPSETVLYCPVLIADPLTDPKKRPKALADAQAVLTFLKNVGTYNGRTFSGVHDRRIQIGGDQTLGRGIVMAHIYA